MGIYSDVQANTTSFDNALPRDGVSRVINREIQAMVEAVDLARASTYDAANAVHTINADTVDHTGGDFILHLHVNIDGTVYHFSTEALAFDVDAATMEAAIDTAADGVVPGFTAGDIAVTAVSTDLQGGNMVLTFSGDSVAGSGQPVTTMTDSRTGGTSPATLIAKTTHGNATREAMATLISQSIVIGAAPTAGANPSWTRGSTALGKLPSLDTIRALARDAARADFNDGVYDAVAALYAI